VKSRERLRIAIQRSGRLSEPTLTLLERCGLSFRDGSDKLFCFGEDEPVDLLRVRDDDIPALIAQGVCDIGIVGRNVLEEFSCANENAACKLQILRPLGFGRCRLSFALPLENEYRDAAQLRGARIATAYPNLLRRWLNERRIDAQVITLTGSVEIAPKLGTADAVCDLVQTGATLAANHLREVETVLESEAVLAAPEELPSDGRGDLIDLLLRRLDDVNRVRGTRLLLLHAARGSVEAIARVLPGTPRLTVLQMDGAPDQVMLQALCASELGWRQLEAIRRAGARELFVLPVECALA